MTPALRLKGPCLPSNRVRCSVPNKIVITKQQTELITKVITTAAKPPHHMTFTSLTLYTHTGWFPSHDCRAYRLFLASPFERVNRVFMSLLVFPLQIKARRGQKVKKKKKEATCLLRRSEIQFNSSTSERSNASSTPFLCLSSLSLSPPSRSVLLWRPPCTSTCVTPASSWETPRCSPVWAPRRRSGWLS